MGLDEYNKQRDIISNIQILGGNRGVENFFFLSFLLFLGPLPRHMEVPRLGVESEL